MRRKVRATRRPKGLTYVINLPTYLNDVWEYLYRMGIKIDMVIFLS